LRGNLLGDARSAVAGDVRMALQRPTWSRRIDRPFRTPQNDPSEGAPARGE
jgi:hypothetical protein